MQTPIEKPLRNRKHQAADIAVDDFYILQAAMMYYGEGWSSRRVKTWPDRILRFFPWRGQDGMDCGLPGQKPEKTMINQSAEMLHDME